MMHLTHPWEAESYESGAPGLCSLSFGSQQQQSSSTPKDMTPEAIKGLQQPFANAEAGLIGGGSSLSGIPNYNPATGAVPGAPVGGNEQQLLGLLQGQSLDPTIRDYLSKTIQGNYLPGGSGSNPFLSEAISAAQRPTLQGLEETLSRTLPGRFTQAGHFTNPQGSSAFDRAAAIATRGAGQTMGDIATKISAANYETERGNQQQAVQLSHQDMQATVSNLQAQALPRLIQQYGIDQGLQLFQTRVDSLLKALATITQTPLQTVANSSQSSGSGFNVGVQNPFSFNYNF